MTKITPQQYEPAFDIAKAMREGRLDTSQALELMVENGFSHSSATMYLNALIAMPVGKVYQKTINNPAARYYLQRFMGEMDVNEFAAVIRSVAGHIRYYNAQGSGKQRQLAGILAEFQTRAEVFYGSAFTTLQPPSDDSQAAGNTATAQPEQSLTEKHEAPTPVFHEGAMKTIEFTVHERDPAARRACIAHFGASCQICNFDFEHTYGELGRGFIHVHHRMDLALADEVRSLNPIDDLLPVCPNCHAMLHTETPAMAVDKLKELLKQNLQG
ncbi:Predicted restriction endonuclease [Shewanella baltica]|uniref:HNH endonuclease n=1 Tax=Shewanella baltica TaxID=62322 RepID=UPI000F6C23C0|nr:HNH endonuclease [Shewanella baltica]VEF25184.1 Predicted restriction endonuclease [Shewanella baltica]